ncbi:hypothetical protein L2E82_10345 [Cichorium intybus]|uniref:Uncharacterized protein n=1 Tax=Cichorium intybus TaxID=13427 RepID=A0ACB9GBD3_CICIN|nr:hypothetical protein L2E82_10345 [Cichorium intybus]
MQSDDDILREKIGLHGTNSWAIIASKCESKTTRKEVGHEKKICSYGEQPNASDLEDSSGCPPTDGAGLGQLAELTELNPEADIPKDKFMRVPDECTTPESKPYTSGENLQHWLTDEKGRDQYVIRAGSDTEVLWNDARQVKADPVYKRPVI